MFLIIFQKSYHLVYDCLLCSPVIGLDLESHSREKVQFFETRSRLSYDHSRISRRERDYILLFSCFETRSRLYKIISHGRARKNEADSHENSRDREFSLISGMYKVCIYKANTIVDGFVVVVLICTFP